MTMRFSKAELTEVPSPRGVSRSVVLGTDGEPFRCTTCRSGAYLAAEPGDRYAECRSCGDHYRPEQIRPRDTLERRDQNDKEHDREL